MSQDYHTPASRIQDPPTVAEEKAQRKAHRDQIADIFKRRPLEELSGPDFEHVTANYHQRISNCRTELGMNITYQKAWITRQDGSKQRIEGSWRYQPYESLGPSSAEYRQTKRLF